MSRERIKRPEPERTQPVRNWSTVFGAPSRTTPPGVHANHATTSREAATDPVSRGVEAGYRVVDEYLRQGQSVARAMWAPFFPGGAPFPNGGAPATPDEMQQRMGAMLKSATDLALMWMDFLGMGGLAGAGVGAGGPVGAPPGVDAGPFSTPGAHAAPRASEPSSEARAETVISIDIRSTRRAEVSVDLRAGSTGLPLRVHDLRAPDHDRRLGHVGIQGFPAEDRVLVRIDVPDDLPAGVYSGLIVDELSSLPRGSVAVRLDA